MSNFDETLMKRLTKLEREVERLKVKESHKAGMYADTYFDDLQYQMVGQKLESPSAHITVSSAEGAIIMAKTCVYPNDYLTMTVQMSHRWKTGSTIYPHLHWWQIASGMPNLMIGYRWQYENKTKTTAWSNIIYSANAFTWSAGLSLNQITKFGSITPTTDAALSDCVQFRIYRDVSNASTLFTGAEVDVKTQDDVYAVSFDIHFEIDSAGSDSEYVK